MKLILKIETHNLIHCYRSDADEWILKVWTDLLAKRVEFSQFPLNFQTFIYEPFVELGDVFFVIGNTILCKDEIEMIGTFLFVIK
jgi:hypothetical protein